jgi:hypothetical protein
MVFDFLQPVSTAVEEYISTLSNQTLGKKVVLHLAVQLQMTLPIRLLEVYGAIWSNYHIEDGQREIDHAQFQCIRKNPNLNNQFLCKDAHH